METRKFGKTNMEVSVLGFGGVEIGFQNTEQAAVDQILNSALDAGVNVIDTSAAYWGSEEKIGKAVSQRRGEFYLLTKCGAIDGFKRYEWSKKGIWETITESLRRLKTDYLDIAQLHSPSEEVLRYSDCIEAMLRAVEKGYTRYIGYSGDNEHARYAIEVGVFDALQTSVNIADQIAIEGNIRLAAEQQMGIVAKRPIANAVWRHTEKPDDPYLHEYWERIQKLQYPFLQKNPERSVAVALRFALSVPDVHTAIVGTTQPEHILQDLRFAVEGRLSDEEFAMIRDRWREIAGENWIQDN